MENKKSDKQLSEFNNTDSSKCLKSHEIEADDLPRPRVANPKKDRK
ncbi:hypothetical protein [Methanococcoides seepicolus]|uniref:Uncharacterized protein n=1 Tax=Methanococcoides seepicolus TaxID=2828780 RepID=A0A9E4ZEG5_9EURY|nr:hypothetical protein [Methanococcoides seepicolus]MCM1986165.1 hypothetical protein [Methanococcoides seepicolus]